MSAQDNLNPAQFTDPVTKHGFKTVDEDAGIIPDAVDLRRTPTVNVPLGRITVASERNLNPDLVARYADNPPKKKPLLRFYGDNDVAVVNGHHTIAGARKRGDKEIRARWMDDGAEDDW